MSHPGGFIDGWAGEDGPEIPLCGSERAFTLDEIRQMLRTTNVADGHVAADDEEPEGDR